jgi:hypothetical protein
MACEKTLSRKVNDSGRNKKFSRLFFFDLASKAFSLFVCRKKSLKQLKALV